MNTQIAEAVEKTAVEFQKLKKRDRAFVLGALCALAGVGVGAYIMAKKSNNGSSK